MSKVGNPQIYEDHEQRYVCHIQNDRSLDAPHPSSTSKQIDHNLPSKHVPDEWYIDIDQLCVSVPPHMSASLELITAYFTYRSEREIGERMREAHQHSMDFARGQDSKSPGADPRVDPLGPATFHGNEPSRGAKIDAEIMAEEHEELKRKGKA